MARKTDKEQWKDFTKNIHSTNRTGTFVANFDNWNEKKAKEERKLCCDDCRHYITGCHNLVGKYHKTCKDFEWW